MVTSLRKTVSNQEWEGGPRPSPGARRVPIGATESVHLELPLTVHRLQQPLTLSFRYDRGHPHLDMAVIRAVLRQNLRPPTFYSPEPMKRVTHPIPIVVHHDPAFRRGNVAEEVIQHLLVCGAEPELGENSFGCFRL
jgi:hypothetical protein